ncbi:MAG: helix-turn-helix domain-containing protein [Mediterraneibacter sp.]|jgi:transcriptional regulator with XRE-family HTH domain
MRIADKIKNARIQKGYTQEQVAENLLVSRQTISNWENGKSLPDIISIIKMSELYELSLDEMMKGDKALLKKVERDVGAVKAEKKLIKFAWISIVIAIILMILGEIIEGNPFIDFMNGALPWILLGLMLLFAILYLNKEEKDKE